MLSCTTVCGRSCGISERVARADHVPRSDGKTGSEAGRRERPTMGAFNIETSLQFEAGRDDMLQVFSSDSLTPRSARKNVALRMEKKLQMQIFASMKAIDPERATTAIAAWARFVDLASRTRSTPFETLAQYLPSRAIDAGEL